jgi:hypothetical protein
LGIQPDVPILRTVDGSSVGDRIAFAIGFARDGYVLISGEPSRNLLDMIGIAAAPLAGVFAGLCLFFFVPRVNRNGG